MVQIHTHWAKGIYWDVIEVLRNQEDYSWSSTDGDLQMLCGTIGCKDEPRFLTWYRDAIRIDLFQEFRGKFTSRGLQKRLKTWESAKKAGEKSAEKRKKQYNSTENNNTENSVANGTATEGTTERQHKNRLDKNRLDNSEIVFDSFRKLYEGNKRGNKTEFDNFKKKHADWETALPLLEPALKNQIFRRQQDSAIPGKFIPEWKHLQTWINQRCWEEESPKETRPLTTNGIHYETQITSATQRYHQMNEMIHGAPQIAEEDKPR